MTDMTTSNLVPRPGGLAQEDWEQGSGHVVGTGGLGTRVWPCGWHGNKGMAMWLAWEDWEQGSGHVVGMGTRVGCFVVCAILDQCVY